MEEEQPNEQGQLRPSKIENALVVRTTSETLPALKSDHNICPVKQCVVEDRGSRILSLTPRLRCVCDVVANIIEYIICKYIDVLQIPAPLLEVIGERERDTFGGSVCR
jgi:hypothetical protein